MGFFDQLRNLFGGSKTQKVRSTSLAPTPPPAEEPEEIEVPQISPAELKAEIQLPTCPLLLDVREQYEWNQVRIPAVAGRTVLHIPMNDIPNRIGEIPKDQAIVVFCAHGSRSYSVAAWLIEQGYLARNLAGGITQWSVQGGDVQQGKASGGGAGGWQ